MTPVENSKLRVAIVMHHTAAGFEGPAGSGFQIRLASLKAIGITVVKYVLQNSANLGRLTKARQSNSK